MKIDFEKIKYSICPACKKHGIPAFSKISRRRTPTLKCKYCHKQFRVNAALSIITDIFIAIFWGILALLFKKYVISLPLWLWGILVIISLFIVEYFIPLEEYNE